MTDKIDSYCITGETHKEYMSFKQFFEAEEEVNNVKAMLDKLPSKHRELVKDFKFRYVSGNTLDGDNQHIGVIEKDIITVAAPWNYGREWVTIHEIAHQIFEKFCTSKWKKLWSKVVKQNPKRQRQNDEELWCMAYSCHFAKHKIEVHNHPTWDAYMEKFCKATGGKSGDKSPRKLVRNYLKAKRKLL